MPGHVILSHGSHSSPEATKVAALAQVAERMGFTTERPDFGDCDGAGHAASVALRIERLCTRVQAAPVPPVLVGSSMGAFTSALASTRERCAGLFLMALPTAIPGCGHDFAMVDNVPTLLVHGFEDEVCSPASALEVARRHRMPTVLVPDHHRLSGHVRMVKDQFRLFLEPFAA